MFYYNNERRTPGTILDFVRARRKQVLDKNNTTATACDVEHTQRNAITGPNLPKVAGIVFGTTLLWAIIHLLVVKFDAYLLVDYSSSSLPGNSVTLLCSSSSKEEGEVAHNGSHVKTCPRSLGGFLKDNAPRTVGDVCIFKVQRNEWDDLMKVMKEKGFDCNFFYENK